MAGRAILSALRQEKRVALLWVCLTLSIGFLFARYHEGQPKLLLSKVHESVPLNSDLSPVLSNLRRDDGEYSCDADNPCGNFACCGSYLGTSKGTCGYGPTYCGSDCTSNCNATAECGQYASNPGQECPLNVCCSQWGFCGSTELFCNSECQSNCVLDPPVPAGKANGGVLNRVIGYYEAWSARRSCYAFPPSALPVQGLTHVNFAFAYIDPDTFKITTMDSATPSSLFTETADVHTLKSGSENLEVFVSIGGWTFSDNDTATQPVFSNIASSAANSQKFADNLVSFMKQYGFDGVDLDWEYPGAPDRGGKEVDTKNYALMLAILRRTFDAAGGYGISFTIPSSYWYLRWFDLPAMLESADWLNLMSYDIHGVWDSNDPIGSIVQAHTNLTEIQEAVELLWRVEVPPEKVVLGLGFYGRSFQLSSSDCSTPGCAFSGPADAGTCTANPGTLAYFEIMDILDKQSPDVIHDKDAAVKYIQFGSKKDQWVSYDDADTFKQKTDWANDVGLGGVMIWAVDLDDDRSSALSGLLGKDLPTFAENEAELEAASGNWASQNGQNCKMTDCLEDSDVGSWGAQWAIAPNGGAFKDSCGKNKNKYIICPVEQMPSTCQWRGGESGCSCHGQCHTGEVTLFHSQHGSRSCCKPGWQAFCCQSDTWSQIVDSCSFSDTDTCPDNKQYVSYRNVYVCERDLDTQYCGFDKQAYCCDQSFPACHWIGKGTCDDNECANYEIEMDTDNYGDTKSQCAGGLNGRKKVLCCQPPTDLNPFLPVSLNNLFPTLPPTTDVPNFDLQQIATEAVSTGGDATQAFGMVVIDGPSDVVTSLVSRDESHIQFLDCEPTKKHEKKLHTVRYICMDDSEASNCDAVHLGGAKGTIVKLPEECGFATYGVVQDIRESSNGSISHELRKRAPANPTVFEMDFSYDFSLVKRDSGDVYVRIDYAHNHEYWTSIVAAEPITRRSLNQSLDARFWSPDATTWKNLIDNVRTVDLDGDYKVNLQSKNFNQLIYQQDSSATCASSTTKRDTSPSGFLSVKLSGTVVDAIRFGFTMVGTIVPSLSFEEAYGYFDSDIDMFGTLFVTGSGSLDIAGSTKPEDLFFSDISDFGFSHPGIVSFAPKMNIDVAMTGAGDLNSVFSVDFYTGSDGRMRTNSPLSLGSLSGDIRDESVSNAYRGELAVEATSATGSDGTILGVNMNVRSWMEVEVDQLGTKLTAATAEFIQQTPHMIRVKTTGDTVRVVSSDQQASVEAYSASISSNWETDDTAHLVGHIGSPSIVYAGSGQDPDDNKPPNWSGSPALSGSYMSCAATRELVCFQTGNLTDWIDDLLDDPDGGQIDMRRSIYADLKVYEGLEDELDERGVLDPRGTGEGRNYTVTTPSGQTFIVTSHSYPNGQNGAYLLIQNPNAGYYILYDPENCEAIDFTSNGDPANGKFVTEHIVELSYMFELLNFAMSGKAKRSDGSYYTLSSTKVVDPGFLDAGSYFQTPWQSWDPTTNTHSDKTASPLDELWTNMGDSKNPAPLANAESGFNGMKMRAWRGMNPVSDATWKANNWDDTSEDTGWYHFEEAMSAIRTVVSVFEYLNADQINQNMAGVYNAFTASLASYDDAILALTGHTIEMSLIHREFFNNFIIPRIESAQTWVTRHLATMRQNWQVVLQQLQNQPTSTRRLADVQQIIDAIDAMAEEAEEHIIIDTSRFTEGPPPPDKKVKRRSGEMPKQHARLIEEGVDLFSNEVWNKVMLELRKKPARK